MRRLFLASAAILALATTPTLAAGSYVAHNINDATGEHVTSVWDESGVGIGPFDPVVAPAPGSSFGTSGGGSSGGAVYGTDAIGAAPTKNPLFMAGIDPSGNIKAAVLTAAGALTTADTLADTALGTPADAAAAVNSGSAGNGSTIAQLKAAVNQLAAILAKLPTNATPLQTGGAVAQGTAASASSAWPFFLVQGTTANSAANPIFEQLTAGSASIGAVTQGGAPWSFNLTQLAGTALGVPTAYGTAPSGNVIGVNANVLASVLPSGAATSANQPSNITQGAALGSQTGNTPFAAATAAATGPSFTTGTLNPLQSDTNGNLRVVLGYGNGTLGWPTQTPLNSSSSVQAFSGGVGSFARVPNASVTTAPATTNATLVKNSQGRVYKLRGCNYATNDLTFHFTNSATAPTPGTTAVQDFFTAPASATAGKCNPFSFDFADIGEYFSTGIGDWVSQNPADADTTAPAATGAYSISIGYQ